MTKGKVIARTKDEAICQINRSPLPLPFDKLSVRRDRDDILGNVLLTIKEELLIVL